MGNVISKAEYESVREMLLMEIRDLKAQIREKDQLIDTLRMMNYDGGGFNGD